MTKWIIFVCYIKLIASIEDGHFLDNDYHPSYDYDNYIYNDYLNQSQNDRLSEPRTYNSTLYKCRCNASEVWDGWECVDRPTKVVVQDPTTNPSIAKVNTDSFQNVKVEEPQCPKGHQLATLDSGRNSVDQFSLLPSGYLYWQQQEFNRYCIEHKLDDVGDTIVWEARVCLSPPSVPLCCPAGQVLTEDLSCSSHISVSHVLSPPIMVDGVPVQWPGELPGTEQNLKCSQYEEILNLKLDSSLTYLKYSPRTASLVWLPPVSRRKEQHQNYCVGVQDGQGYQVKVCHEDVVASHHRQCDQHICVRKCCQEQEVINGQSCSAVRNHSDMWKPSFINSNNSSPNAMVPEDFKIVSGFPLCSDYYQLEPDQYEEDRFVLQNDGHLFVPSLPDHYSPTHYCIDNHYDTMDTLHVQALVCFEESALKSVCAATHYYVFPLLLVASCVFLSITLLIYLILPELRNKLHGKCLISLVSSLLVGYVCLVVVSLATGTMSLTHCRFTALVMLFAFLSSYFWLNTLCFDIWRTLRKMRITSGPRWNRRRFLLYSIYSWGCPLIITLVAVIMESLPESYDVIRPDFGTDFCWFSSKASKWAYFYGYVLVLVIVNIIFFTLVTIILTRSKDDQQLTRNRNVNRERLWLCGKLFLVMGVTWLAEVISMQQEACAWIVTDVINTLQGVSIFFVFVCSKTTLHMLRAKYDECRGKQKPSNSSQATNSSMISSTRQYRDSINSTTSYSKDSPRPHRNSTSSSHRKYSENGDMVPLKTLREGKVLDSDIPNLHPAMMAGEKSTGEGSDGLMVVGKAGTNEKTTPMLTTEEEEEEATLIMPSPSADNNLV